AARRARRVLRRGAARRDACARAGAPRRARAGTPRRARAGRARARLRRRSGLLASAPGRPGDARAAPRSSPAGPPDTARGTADRPSAAERPAPLGGARASLLGLTLHGAPERLRG